METKTKSKKKLIFIVVALVLVLSAIGQNKEVQTDSAENASSKNINVTIKPEVEVFNDGSVQFFIKTNLPEKTKLLVTVEDENGYCGADNAEVLDNGLAIAGEFTNKGEALKGKYKVSITMGLPRYQEESVQKIIGKKGENLSGKYVVEDDMVTGDKYIVSEFDFEF